MNAGSVPGAGALPSESEEGGGGSPRARAALVLGLAVFALILLLPAPAGLARDAWRLAAVSGLMIVWWIGEALPIGATSLLPLVLFPLLGIRSAAATAASYGDPIVFLFLGAFLIALATERSGLHRRFALGMIAAIGAEPRRLVVGFLAATSAISMWINNTAVTLMMLPVGISVVERLAGEARIDGRRDDATARAAARSFGSALMLAIAYGASVGGMGTLVGTAPNLVFAGAMKTLFPAEPEVGFLRWMLLGVPLVVVLVALLAPALLHLAPETPLRRFDFGAAGAAVLREERRQLGPMSPAERIVLGGFVLAVVLWIFRTPLELGSLRIPGWSDLLSDAGFSHDAVVAVGIGLALLALRARGGEGGPEVAALLDWRTVERRVPWGVLLLMGGGFALAAGFESTGLAASLATRLGALAGAPVVALIAAIAAFTTLVSEVASNTATATLLMPLLAATSRGLGVSPLLLLVPATLAASCGFVLPVATPPNAIVFGTGWVPIWSMVRTGLFLDVAGVVCITIVCRWWLPVVMPGAGG